jgi:predicted ATPase
MSLKSKIESISQMKAANVFNNFIEYIRFPFYRNLESNSKITFDFPLTFFVGKNGGGKSSTLQSLYGCPKGKSLGDYWFSTELDPIKESDERNCFIYGYLENNQLKEVLKQRGLRRKSATKRADLDYWETSKPVKSYEMDTRGRNNPVDKNVEYIDFRSELSAFDSYMYFMPFNATKSVNSKQDFIRKHSRKMREAFDSKREITSYNSVKNKIAKSLSNEEVIAISQILGKNYSKIEILDHNFLKNWGFSVRFTSHDFSYSEAFAGSGETAIIVLVHKIHNCPDGTLLLLDEPEVSLHSGAQKRLLHYLLEQIKKKKLQIIISTHSPFFLDGMPSNSIKVFSLNNVGKFHIENSREPKEAFYELEIDNFNEKIQIIVEDSLAKKILEAVLTDLGIDVFSSFEIKYLPGGSSALKKRIATFLELNNPPVIIFDGDQNLLGTHFDIKQLSLIEIDSVAKLNNLIIQQTGEEISFFVDGNKSGGNEEQKQRLRLNYLDYYLNNVFYFPKKIPEDIIWDYEYALEKVNAILGLTDKALLDNIVSSGDSKGWFINLCILLYSKKDNLETLQQEFIIRWSRRQDDSYAQILALINHIRAKE